MKKFLLLVVVLGGAVGAGFLHMRGMLPGVKTERGDLLKKSGRFLECLKFKEFNEAAAFHSPQDLKENEKIPKMLENFFMVPHENLDIQDISIDFIDFDSTGKLAKVKTTTSVRLLNKNQDRSVESMLYWKKDGDRWYLDMRTTLERGVGKIPQ
ncbi:MAG: hypothetical protein COB53_04935 [Elusimicrobia bacterium]|nr:MAG: hypothetical protein COB53_04935 [Elusimicrobiota bacterium]